MPSCDMDCNYLFYMYYQNNPYFSVYQVVFYAEVRPGRDFWKYFFRSCLPDTFCDLPQNLITPLVQRNVYSETN